MRLFDLHCDTLTKLLPTAYTLADNPFQVSLSGAAAFSAYRQFFAAFIPDALHGDEAAFYFQRLAARFRQEMAGTQAFPGFRGYLSVENCMASSGTLAGVARFWEQGVRMASLTWNGDNAFACGCHTKNDLGLSLLGRETVRLFCRDGIVTDLSHLSAKGISQVLALTEYYGGRVAASHSNCLTATNAAARRRALSDAQVRALAERGAPLGLNLYAPFLADGAAGEADVLRNIERALTQGAGRSLALGCDFDGCEPVPAFAGVAKLPALYAAVERGFSRQLADALFFENAARFFEKAENKA